MVPLWASLNYSKSEEYNLKVNKSKTEDYTISMKETETGQSITGRKYWEIFWTPQMTYKKSPNGPTELARGMGVGRQQQHATRKTLAINSYQNIYISNKVCLKKLLLKANATSISQYDISLWTLRQMFRENKLITSPS